jgi:hypothetical protein
MRKFVPLVEAAAKSQLPDVMASCCGVGVGVGDGIGVGVGDGAVLEFPPQPAIKRAKNVTTTTERKGLSSMGNNFSW